MGKNVINVMYVPEQESPRQLPIYKIRGKFYFRDVRLGEYRNTRNFMDRIPINDVSLSDLQTPTKADRLRKVL